MSGPAWLAGSFAVLMVVIAVYCAGRLAVSRLRGRDTELDTDGLHILMGVAMAGMLEPRLTPVPVTAWRAVFAAAAAWFAWRAIRPGRRGRGHAARTRRPRRRMRRHGLHAGACRLLARGPRAGHGDARHEPGPTTGNPALTLVLALFMLGYVLWAIDRLARLSRATAPATAMTTAGRPPQAAQIMPVIPGAPRPPPPPIPTPRAGPALAPRLAAAQDRHGHHHGIHAHHDALASQHQPPPPHRPNTGAVGPSQVLGRDPIGYGLLQEPGLPRASTTNSHSRGPA